MTYKWPTIIDLQMTYKWLTNDLQMTYKWPTNDLQMTYKWPTNVTNFTLLCIFYLGITIQYSCAFNVWGLHSFWGPWVRSHSDFYFFNTDYRLPTECTLSLSCCHNLISIFKGANWVWKVGVQNEIFETSRPQGEEFIVFRDFETKKTVGAPAPTSLAPLIIAV